MNVTGQLHAATTSTSSKFTWDSFWNIFTIVCEHLGDSIIIIVKALQKCETFDDFISLIQKFFKYMIDLIMKFIYWIFQSSSQIETFVRIYMFTTGVICAFIIYYALIFGSSGSSDTLSMERLKQHGGILQWILGLFICKVMLLMGTAIALHLHNGAKLIEQPIFGSFNLWFPIAMAEIIVMSMLLFGINRCKDMSKDLLPTGFRIVDYSAIFSTLFGTCLTAASSFFPSSANIFFIILLGTLLHDPMVSLNIIDRVSAFTNAFQ